MSNTAAASPEEGVQGAETDVLYSSVYDNFWSQRPEVVFYRMCMFVTGEEKFASPLIVSQATK